MRASFKDFLVNCWRHVNASLHVNPAFVDNAVGFAPYVFALQAKGIVWRREVMNVSLQGGPGATACLETMEGITRRLTETVLSFGNVRYIAIAMQAQRALIDQDVEAARIKLPIASEGERIALLACYAFSPDLAICTLAVVHNRDKMSSMDPPLPVWTKLTEDYQVFSGLADRLIA